MEPVIARWEWRTFGQSFGPADPKLAALVAEKVQQSDEIYLLAISSDANVKIRDGLMDIKLLENVDDNGLEQWRPVFKGAFPLDEAAVATVRSALALPESPPPAHELSLEELLASTAAPQKPIRSVKVSKTRTRFHIMGCVAERTEVIADGTRVLTVAIEDPVPARVLAAVKSVGLEGFPNTSYPRGLKQLLGLMEGGKR
jgi:exopolyphosphatase/guanosine-5'-triphosphate,3'-diphosphate pyrophosphatase